MERSWGWEGAFHNCWLSAEESSLLIQLGKETCAWNAEMKWEKVGI